VHVWASVPLLASATSLTSFEAWRQHLQYTLSLDPNFAGFLIDGFTWQKKTNAQPLRDFADDGEDVAEANRRTAAQKCIHLELILGQIINYCPIISRNTIVKNSTSISSIWQSIRLHYGFQSTEAHFRHVKPSIRNPAKFGSKDSVYCKFCHKKNPVIKHSINVL
jgi:hypothetical protein